MSYLRARAAVVEADDALAIPNREELLGCGPAEPDDSLTLDDLPAPVVAFDSTLSLTGVTEFFHDERSVSHDERDDEVPAKVVTLTITDASPARRFIDQFDRFASDFHAFASECQASLRP